MIHAVKNSRTKRQRELQQESLKRDLEAKYSPNQNDWFIITPEGGVILFPDV